MYPKAEGKKLGKSDVWFLCNTALKNGPKFLQFQSCVNDLAKNLKF